MKKQILLFICLFPFHFVFADEGALWTCIASDNQAKQWSFSNDYRRVATNKALAICKKNSAAPVSCEVSENNCNYSGPVKEQVGFNSVTIWQCTALDSLANAWNNELTSNKYNAALNAKDTCKRYSIVPESCYVNLLTCKIVSKGN